MQNPGLTRLQAFRPQGGERAGLCQPPPAAGHRPAFVAGREGDLEGAGPNTFEVGAFAGAHETARRVSLVAPRGQKGRVRSGEHAIGIPHWLISAGNLRTKHVVCLTC